MIAITLVLAFGMVWVSTRSKFVPYVVEVDKLGYAMGAPSALTENTPRISTDRMVRYELAAFLRAPDDLAAVPCISKFLAATRCGVIEHRGARCRSGRYGGDCTSHRSQRRPIIEGDLA
jgi:hypothetical protein